MASTGCCSGVSGAGTCWSGTSRVATVFFRYAAWCSSMSLVFISDFIEIRIDIVPVTLQRQAVFEVRLNISHLYVVCLFYLHVEKQLGWIVLHGIYSLKASLNYF